jgi:hypothetical protein
MALSLTIQEPLWWDMCAGINGIQPHGESPHHAQPPRPSGTLRALRLHGPMQRQLRGDELGPLLPEELDKVPQRPGRFREFGSERSSKGDVFR